MRRILVVGAIAVLRRAQENPGKYPWLTQLLARRPFKVVAVALANKTNIVGRIGNMICCRKWQRIWLTVKLQ